MRVDNLIHILQQEQPDTEVLIFNPDAPGYYPVTGLIIDTLKGPGHNGTIKLYADIEP